jgi:hypothetical protein
MSDEGLQAAVDLFRVLESGDVELARTAAARTFQNREAAVAAPACSLPGPAGLLASSAWMRSAFDELEFPIEQTGFADGVAWVRLRMRGVHRGPFVQFKDGRADRVLAPTGRRIDFQQIHVLRTGRGGVTTHEAIRDDLTMLGQLGVFPPGPRVLVGMVVGKLSGAERRAVASVVEATERAAAAA